ncbi:alpha/beta hydrolase family protein [Elusimicrobiota bacterium]
MLTWILDLSIIVVLCAYLGALAQKRYNFTLPRPIIVFVLIGCCVLVRAVADRYFMKNPGIIRKSIVPPDINRVRSRFPVFSSSEEHKNYIASFRKDLKKVLFIDDIPKKGYPTHSLIESRELGGIIREKLVLSVDSRVDLSAYLFRPGDTSKKYPGVIVFHGHGVGKENTAIDQDSYERALALYLAQNGYVVLAYDNRGFNGSDGRLGHKEAARLGILSGNPHAGDLVRDGLMAIEWFRALEYIDDSAVSVAGVSMGGWLSLFVSALSDKVSAAVIAGAIASYSDEFVKTSHCLCAFIPGILRIAEISDIAASIAPRPLLVIHGENDDVFPVARVDQVVSDILAPMYALYNKSENFKYFKHSGDHVMHNQAALNWFNAHVSVSRDDPL